MLDGGKLRYLGWVGGAGKLSSDSLWGSQSRGIISQTQHKAEPWQQGRRPGEQAQGQCRLLCEVDGVLVVLCPGAIRVPKPDWSRLCPGVRALVTGTVDQPIPRGSEIHLPAFPLSLSRSLRTPLPHHFLLFFTQSSRIAIREAMKQALCKHSPWLPSVIQSMYDLISSRRQAMSQEL